MTLDIALFERADDDAIEAWASALPAEGVVPALHSVTQLAKALRVADKMLRSRIVSESILSAGEAWTAPDGREFVWAGDRERVCGDPTSLRTQLASLPLGTLALKALAHAFKDQEPRLYFTYLDQVAKFGGEEAERVIRSFVTWKETAPKLREIGEDGK